MFKLAESPILWRDARYEIVNDLLSRGVFLKVPPTCLILITWISILNAYILRVFLVFNLSNLINLHIKHESRRSSSDKFTVTNVYR